MQQIEDCVRVLMRPGGVAILRTDTLYGMVARANDQQAVERVYRLRHRDGRKSCIVLIADWSDVYDTDSLSELETLDLASRPTSVLLKSTHAPEWLLRQNDELAYRVPAVDWLREVLRQTGPLIAPSANPEGLSPARTIRQAREYFGDEVDAYFDGGEVPADTPPSRVVRRHADGELEYLR